MITRAQHFHTHYSVNGHALSYGPFQIIRFDQHGRWKSWSTFRDPRAHWEGYVEHRAALTERVMELLPQLRFAFDIQHPRTVRAAEHSAAKHDRMAYYARGLNELIPMGGEF